LYNPIPEFAFSPILPAANIPPTFSYSQRQRIYD
jgi:hypothetical protein